MRGIGKGKGKETIAGLREFNTWFDEFILTAAKPLSMIGFAMGTVDIFNRGGLATNPYFAFGWSLVQAITIDGLFFAVWYRLFEQGISRWRRFFLGVIGLVLAVVVVITNSILGFQQLWGVSDSQTAMVRLGIEPGAFTLVRAVLVVIVAIMVAFVSRGVTDGENTGVGSTETAIDLAMSQSENNGEQGENETSRRETSVVITETENETPLLEMKLHEISPTTREISRENLTNSEILTGERVRQAAKEAVQTDLDLNLKQFSGETGIPYNTLYRWRREMLAEKRAAV